MKLKRFANRPWIASALLATGMTLVVATPRPAAAQQASTQGSWSLMQSLPVSMAHAVLLPSGKVIFWGTLLDGLTPFLWDPASNQITKVAAPSFNLFCSGDTMLANGRMFAGGGYAGVGAGADAASIFDPVAGAWADQPKMNAGRLCPSAITLANGDVLVLSGQLTPAPPPPPPPALPTPAPLNPLKAVFEVSTATWRGLTTAPVIAPILSRAFLAPDGRVFLAGPGPKTYWLATDGTGSSIAGPITVLGTERTYGNAVMYDTGKILLVGGGVVPTATAETVDLTAPVFTAVAPMSTPRRHQNGTVLPDGTVLVTGGTKSGALFNDPTGSVPMAEVWDPAKNTWTQLSAASSYRGYNSIALLLPDGRVLVGGGNLAADKNYQVFSPPYLAAGGARPSIDDAPAQVWPGAQFFVKTASGASIAKVALVRPGAATHSWNSNQRYVPLQFTVDGANGQGLVVTGPVDNNAAPAGDYMLFLVDSNGVPSIAKFVNLVYGPTAGPAPALNVPPPVQAQKASPSPKSKGGCSAAGSGTGSIPAAAMIVIAIVALRRRMRARA